MARHPSRLSLPEYNSCANWFSLWPPFSAFRQLASPRARKLTQEDNVATLEFPDSWKISNIKRGLQAKSPDEEVYVWAELVPADQIDTVQKEQTPISRSRR